MFSAPKSPVLQSQVRITMQSLGHPLVSDDRYLPRDQAMADCQWCPRNFLCEVRQDWFDMCGPYKHPERRRFQRISIENPLPPLFQDILEKKLELMQKLDPTADLYQGCLEEHAVFKRLYTVLGLNHQLAW